MVRLQFGLRPESRYGNDHGEQGGPVSIRSDWDVKLDQLRREIEGERREVL